MLVALSTVLMLAGGVVRRASAQVPALLNHQGRVSADGVWFDGVGRFRFALVAEPGTAGENVVWRSSPDEDANGLPDQAVQVPVVRGVYAVALGDTSTPNMASLTPSIFVGGSLWLRVWFDDGVHGPERLSPDHRVAAAGYAFVASTVPDGSISTAKLGSDVRDQLTALSDRVLALESLPAGTLPRGVPVVSDRVDDPALLGAGYQPFLSTSPARWMAGSTANTPTARSGQPGAWTGSRFLVWGGWAGSDVYLGTGAAYDPTADVWQAISPVDAPAGRTDHVMAWTGTELLIWGGRTGGGYLVSGGRYDAASGVWHPTTQEGAPAGRVAGFSAWTGTRLLIWGGRNAGGVLAGGAAYDPATDRWTTLPDQGAPPASYGGVGLWTEAGFLVWGGQGIGGRQGTGGLLTLREDGSGSWNTMPAEAAPAARMGHAAVWTGTEFLVWGGLGAGGGAPLGTGGRYRPSTGSWSPLPLEGAPEGRVGHAMVWTGKEVLVLGGEGAAGFSTEAYAFHPGANRWRKLAGLGGPIPRRDLAAAWTGAEVLLFGGRDTSSLLGALQRFDPQPPWHFFRHP